MRRRAAALALLLALGAGLAPGWARAAPPGCEPGAMPLAQGHRLGVVFAGGGSKAAYEAGLALALHEMGVVPGAVAGTSSGALNAVMVSAGDTERLAALWRSVRREDVFHYRAVTVLGGLLPGWFAIPYFRNASSLLDPSPLRELIERHLDLARVRESAVRVLVLAADLVSGQARRFDNATLTVDALMASVTVPGLFPVVSVDGAWLVDGGIVQRAPTLELLAAHPLDRLLVVLGYEGVPPTEPTLQPVLERAFEMALGREILRDAELARWRHPRVDVRVLRPSEPLSVRPLEFDGAALGRLVDLGRRDGLACLAALGYGS